MGYRALKLKAEKKKTRLRRILLCVFAAVLLGGVIFSFFVPPESWKYHFAKPSVVERGEGELRIHFIDVGQGDCTLLELPDGKTALIDGGNDSGETKKSVMRYLNALDIDVIDYLIITHTDSDHCGSLEEVFRYKSVLNAYMPASFDASDLQYAEVYEAATQEEECAIKELARMRISTAEGGYNLAILYPYSQAAGGERGSDNENSAVVWLEYEGVKAIFCGDAPMETENILLRDERLGVLSPFGVTLSDTQILKVSHHGSKSGTGAEFLSRLGVRTAVISCGENNAYNHPSAEAVRRLQTAGAEIYRTDRQGDVCITITREGKYTVGVEKEETED